MRRDRERTAGLHVLRGRGRDHYSCCRPRCAQVGSFTELTRDCATRQAKHCEHQCGEGCGLPSERHTLTLARLDRH